MHHCTHKLCRVTTKILPKTEKNNDYLSLPKKFGSTVLIKVKKKGIYLPHGGDRRFSEACRGITVRDMTKRTAGMDLEGHIYPIHQVSAFSFDNIGVKLTL